MTDYMKDIKDRLCPEYCLYNRKNKTASEQFVQIIEKRARRSRKINLLLVDLTEAYDELK